MRLVSTITRALSLASFTLVTVLVLPLMTRSSSMMGPGAVTSVDVLVKDPGDINTRAHGAAVKIPVAMGKYVVTAKFEADSQGRENYRRVAIYSRVGNKDCLQNTCWERKGLISLQGESQSVSYLRTEHPEILITAWGFNVSEGNSKAGAPYKEHAVEEKVVGGKKTIKLTFTSGFGAGTTIVTIQKQ